MLQNFKNNFGVADVVSALVQSVWIENIFKKLIFKKRPPRLIWVFAGRKGYFVVMSRCGSNLFHSHLSSIHVYWNAQEQMSRLMTQPTKCHVRPAKTQISLGIRPVWVFAGRTCHLVVLPWGGSNVIVKWASSYGNGTYRICEQRSRRLRWACQFSLFARTIQGTRKSFRQRAGGLVQLDSCACAFEITETARY